MKQKLHFRWLLSIVLCCISFVTQAATVKISGCTATQQFSGYPLFVDVPSTITVSSSSGKFNYVYIDDVKVAYNSNSYWSSYKINIASYLDGQPHKLQLKHSFSDYGICYFQSREDLSINGLFYSVSGSSATLIGSAYAIEDAIILDEYEYDGVKYPVTAIADKAFYSHTNLQSVSISTIQTIGASAFYNCNALTSVTIPESVTSIGTSAFEGCSSLSTLTFNAINCSTCGSSSYPAFPSAITSLTFGNNVTKIPDYLLSNGSKIESLTIPNSVTTIGNNAFRNCSVLSSVTIPENVVSIGSSAFEGCSSLSTLTFNATNCSTCGSSSYPTFPSSITSLTFGNNVTKIPDYLLYSGSEIESLTIPNSVTKIGLCAFSNCSSLTTLTFNATNCSPCTVGSFPSSISSLTFGNNVTKIPDDLLSNGSKIESLTIPNSVTTIGRSAFENSNNLKSLTLGSGLLSIGSHAFSYYTSSNSSYHNIIIAKVFWLCNTPPTNSSAISALVNYVANDQYSLSNQKKYQFLSSKFTVDETVYVPVSPSDRTCDVIDCVYSLQNGDIVITDKVVNRGVELTVQDINDFSFYQNQTITSLTISNQGILGNKAFYNCDALTIVNASNNGYIGDAAFMNCDTLTSVDVSNKGDIGAAAFYLCGALLNAVVNNVGAIGNSAFEACHAINSVSLGDSITIIGNHAFKYCFSLPTITIPNNVTSIGEYIFYGCSKLATVNIGTGIVTIPQYAFADCSTLNNVSIPYNVKSIGNYVFSGCSSLSNLTFEDCEPEEESSNSNIYDNLQLGSNGSNPLFVNCPLDVVYIGRRLSYNTDSNYGYSPFYRNTSLRSVDITDAETNIYDNEFYGCTNLKTLKIGNRVKTIGKWAFSGCSSLDYFSAGYHVESIGEEAFSDCTGLTNYYSFSILPPVCGNQALDDINKWECELFVPAESSDEYMAADQWKDFFFVNENDAVLIETIRINVESLDGKTGDAFQLVADILPGNATRKTVEWSSGDPSIASIDATGLVNFIKEGNTTITVRATDGSGVEASIEVVVTVKEPELGDSNANGVVNIADAVNIANFSIGNEVEHFNETAADVNQDGIITLADASATITLILDQPVAASTIAKGRGLQGTQYYNSDILVIADFAAKLSDTATIPVTLDNTFEYVALQADVFVPEGMSLIAVKIGDRAEMNHSLAVKRIDDRTMRVAIFDLNNSTFADNSEAIIELVVKANSATTEHIELNNIIASDANANEYILTSTGGNNTEMSGIDSVVGNNIRIEPAADSIEIYNAESYDVAIYTLDGVLLTHFTATSEIESCKVVPGMYLVSIGTTVKKVMVK